MVWVLDYDGWWWRRACALDDGDAGAARFNHAAGEEKNEYRPGEQARKERGAGRTVSERMGRGLHTGKHTPEDGEMLHTRKLRFG